MKVIFEKFAAFVFLFLLIGLIAFLTYIPVPVESDKLITAIIGGLMVVAAQALPNLFGATDTEKERLLESNNRLKSALATVEEKFETVLKLHNDLLQELVRHHVVLDQTILHNEQIGPIGERK